MAALLILLKILKILGFILLGILGFILFLVLLILIAPLHYRAEGHSDEEMDVSVRVTYLARFLKLLFTYDKANGIKVKATLLWGLITITPNEPDFTRDYVRKRSGGDEGEPSEADGETVEGDASDAVSDEAADNAESGLDDGMPTDGDAMPENDAIPAGTEPVKDEDGISQKIKKEKHKKEKHKKHKKEKTKDESEDTRSVFEKIKDFKEKWFNSGNKRAVSHTMKQVVFILKKYAPRKAAGDIIFSTGDPATTGEIIGGLALMPFMYSKHFSAVPDFEAEKFYVKGRMMIKGFIQIGVILIAAVRLILNRDVRKLIKLFISK